MIEVALLLQEPGLGVKPVRVSMKDVPRNGDYISYDGGNYVVTFIRHLIGKVPVLVGSQEEYERALVSAPVEVEVTAWKR